MLQIEVGFGFLYFALGVTVLNKLWFHQPWRAPWENVVSGLFFVGIIGFLVYGILGLIGLINVGLIVLSTH